MTSDERPRAMRVRRDGRFLGALLPVLHVIYYAIMGLLFVVMLVLGIGAAADGAQPT